jgi:hypothetical protein
VGGGGSDVVGRPETIATLSQIVVIPFTMNIRGLPWDVAHHQGPHTVQNPLGSPEKQLRSIAEGMMVLSRPSTDRYGPPMNSSFEPTSLDDQADRATFFGVSAIFRQAQAPFGRVATTIALHLRRSRLLHAYPALVDWVRAAPKRPDAPFIDWTRIELGEVLDVGRRLLAAAVAEMPKYLAYLDQHAGVGARALEAPP